jgi:TonB family protein
MRPWTNTATSHELLMLRTGRERAGIQNATIEREESIDFAGQPALCTVAKAEYSNVPWGPRPNNAERILWIAKDTDLILRDEWEVSAFNWSRREIIEYSEIEQDKTMDPKVFVFAPPAASHEMGPPATPVTMPVITRRIEPAYTPEARAAGYQGTVSRYLEVTPEGKAENVKVMEGLGLGLDEKAIEAAARWQYKPGMLDGHPARMAVSARINFHLDQTPGWKITSAVYKVNPDTTRQEIREKPVLRHYVLPSGDTCRAASIEFQISAEGLPASIHSSDAASALTPEVVQAVSAWRYSPGVTNGQPRASQARLDVECDLDVPNTYVYRVGGGVSQPAVARKFDPEYSEEARLAKFNGTVTMQIVVGADGRAHDFVISRLLGLRLDEKAMEAVKSWRFKPGLRNGEPVNVRATVEVNFRLL